MNVCIGILTTATRPETLELCLRSICKLELPSLDKLTVLIVENNQEHSLEVKQLIHDIAQETNIPFTTVLEQTRGIPFGRNAALNYAIENDFSHLAFVDDDAEISPTWLVTLVDSLQKTDAQAVTGPQIPIFPEKSEKLYTTAQVYKERNLEDGTVCKWAATNNILFDVKFADEHAIQFSTDMKTGGSDKEFFTRYTKNGGKIVWVKNAAVYEYVESERISKAWAVRRTFRFGGTGYRIERSDKNKFHALVTCCAKGSAYVLKGLLGCIVNPFRPNKSNLDGVCDLAHGAAFFMSIFTGGTLKKYT